MSENQPSPSRPSSQDEAIDLGQEIAAAHRAEEVWKEAGGRGVSPLPAMKYDFWRGDHCLIRPTPNPLDETIRDVCRHFAQRDAQERARLRNSSTLDEFYTLMNFSSRSAVFALREADKIFAIDGLNAIAMIEPERVDFRDILMCLGLLYHAAHRAGGDADAMFRAAAALAAPEANRMLIDFTAQTPKHRNIRQSWGYDEVETEVGLGFIGWGFERYKPIIDLKAAIIDVSDLVAADCYQPSQIEVATDLPDIWLGGATDEPTRKILAAIRGGATVSAELRPDKHQRHASQQFTLFLVEAARESDAQALLGTAQSHTASDHCQLALARGPLFCLVVARSFIVGKPSYETTESLTRLAPGLAAILERHAGRIERNWRRD